jgi:hypothetical protein
MFGRISPVQEQYRVARLTRFTGPRHRPSRSCITHQPTALPQYSTYIAVCNIEPPRPLALPRDGEMPTPRFCPSQEFGFSPPGRAATEGGDLLYIALHLAVAPVSATCTVPRLLRHTPRSATRPQSSLVVTCSWTGSYTCSRTTLRGYAPSSSVTREGRFQRGGNMSSLDSMSCWTTVTASQAHTGMTRIAT